MNIEFRLLPIVAALSMLGTAPVMADSAVGVDTVLGNAASPGGLETATRVDARGYSIVMEGKGPSHTPSGQLYEYPNQAPEVAAGSNGWGYTGSVEAGYIGNDGHERAAGFREYTDWKNGALINSFGLNAEQAEDARYVKFRGGGVGRRDQYFQLEAGKYNGLKLSAFYNETPHVFAGNARPLWNGVGTGRLTLPAGLTAGSHTQADPASYAALQTAVANAPTVELGIDRKKVGLRAESELAEGWTGYVTYSNEKREGARPFGGAFLFDFIRPATGGGGTNALGAVMETVEPIDYTTQDLLTGVRFVGTEDRLNLSLSASLFRNDIKSLTWDNPFGVNFGTVNANSSSWEQGRSALAPDNDAYSLRAEYARVLPLRGQLTSTVAITRMRQDDDLLPPTINDGVNAAGANTSYAAAIAGYNTTAVLSRKTAQAAIDTQLADVGLSLHPADDLTVRGKLRYYEEKNKTDYTAIDPNSGKIGYPGLDYGLAGMFGVAFGFFNGTNNLHYKSIPTSYTRWTANAGSDYRITALTQIGLDYEREQTKRPYREVERVDEDRLKLAVNSRAFDSATLRASWEYSARRGTHYNADPYEHFYTSSLPAYTNTNPIVHTLADLRKYDLADRDQHIVNVRWNQMLRQDMDAFLSLQHKQSDYVASGYGRVGKELQDTVNAEWSFNPAPGRSVFAFYSYQQGQMEQGNINNQMPNPAAASWSDEAGGLVYPLGNAWTAKSRERNHVIGGGFNLDLQVVRFESRYSISWARTRQTYAYVDAASATEGSGTRETQSAAVAGNEFADMKYRNEALESSLIYPFDRNSALRFYHRWEKRTTTDWHYTGLDSQRLIDQRLYLGATPQDYNTQMVGLFYQHRL